MSADWVNVCQKSLKINSHKKCFVVFFNIWIKKFRNYSFARCKKCFFANKIDRSWKQWASQWFLSEDHQTIAAWLLKRFQNDQQVSFRLFCAVGLCAVISDQRGAVSNHSAHFTDNIPRQYENKPYVMLMICIKYIWIWFALTCYHISIQTSDLYTLMAFLSITSQY